MTRIRLARGVLLAFLVAFAIWVGFDIWRSPEPSQATPAPREVPAAPAQFPPGGPVEEASETFQFTSEKGGVVVSRLSAGKMLGMEGGSRVLSHILIEMRPDPETDPQRVARVEGQAGHFDADTHEVILQGGVELLLSTGERLHADELRYRLDRRQARSDGPVQFSFHGAEGSAVGLDADLAAERLVMRADVVITFADDGSESAPTVLESDSLHHDATAEVSRLEGTVHISGDWGSFSGQDLHLRRQPGGDTEGISRRPGTMESRTGSSAPLRLEANHWVFLLGDGNRLQSVTASHDPRLTGSDESEAGMLEELTAESIFIRPAAAGVPAEWLAQSDNEDLVRARFRQAAVDEVLARTLIIREVEPGAQEAIFTGQVRATGAGRSATGTRLRVTSDHEAVLTGEAERPARVMESDRLMTAQEIVFRADGGGVATGGVELQMTPSLPTTPDEDAEPTLAAVAQRASFAAGGDSVRLEGEVRTWRGENSLSAAWVEVEKGASRLTAGGGITTSWRPGEDGAEAMRASGRLQVRARTLVWEHELERASYTGDVQMIQDDAEVKADRFVLETGTNGNDLFVAEGHVEFQDSSWSGTGDRLTYHPTSESYLLESFSSLARVEARDQGGSLTGRILHISRADGTVKVSSQEGGRTTIQFDGQEPGAP